MRDYIFLQSMYLLLVDYIEEENEFYLGIIDHYISHDSIKYMQYYGYDLYDIIPQYVIKYYYNDLTNFSATFGNKNIYTPLEKKLDKDGEKMNHLFDNIAVSMIENDTIETAKELSKNKEDKIEMIWRTAKDENVCEICEHLNGTRFLPSESLPTRHPNCRCYYEIYKNGELFTIK